MTEKNYVTDFGNINCFESSYSEESIYNYPNRLMISWWVKDSYFNNEQIQIGDIWIMNHEYGSSGSFGSRVRSKSIEHNTYIYRRSNICSKPTPVHELVHNYYLNYHTQEVTLVGYHKQLLKTNLSLVSES